MYVDAFIDTAKRVADAIKNKEVVQRALKKGGAAS
jgi:hypothetical protein